MNNNIILSFKRVFTPEEYITKLVCVGYVFRRFLWMR